MAYYVPAGFTEAKTSSGTGRSQDDRGSGQARKRTSASEGFNVEASLSPASPKMQKLDPKEQVYTEPRQLHIHSRRINYHELIGASLKPCDSEIRILEEDGEDYLATVGDNDGVYRIIERKSGSEELIQCLSDHKEQWGDFSSLRPEVPECLIYANRNKMKIISAGAPSYRLKGAGEEPLSQAALKSRSKQFKQILKTAVKNLQEAYIYQKSFQVLETLHTKYLSEEERVKYPLSFHFYGPSACSTANFLHQDDGWLQVFFATEDPTILYPVLTFGQKRIAFHHRCKPDTKDSDKPEACQPLCLNKALDDQNYGIQPPVNKWHICSGNTIHRGPLKAQISRCIIGGNISLSADLETLLRRKGCQKDFMAELNSAIGLSSIPEDARSVN